MSPSGQNGSAARPDAAVKPIDPFQRDFRWDTCTDGRWRDPGMDEVAAQECAALLEACHEARHFHDDEWEDPEDLEAAGHDLTPGLTCFYSPEMPPAELLERLSDHITWATAHGHPGAAAMLLTHQATVFSVNDAALAADDPAWRPHLARSLWERADHWKKANRTRDALTAQREATAVLPDWHASTRICGTSPAGVAADGQLLCIRGRRIRRGRSSGAGRAQSRP